MTIGTTGQDLDTDGYRLTLTDEDPRDVDVNASTTFESLGAGTYLLGLEGISDNCQVTGANPRSVVVTAGASASSGFAVACVREDVVLFTSARASTQSLWAMEPDGSRPRRMTTGGIDIDAAWAPDGSHFAYVSQRGATDELWVAAWDGSGGTRIFEGSPVRGPQWSPDGTRIVFVASTHLGPADLWIVGADGSDPVNLTNDEQGGGYQRPHWSPDGMRILFESSRSGSQNRDVWAMGPDGSSLTNLTDTPGHDIMPISSPDGTRIAYVRDDFPDRDLWVVGFDGANPVLLATLLDVHEHRWSPDGARISFLRDDDVWLIGSDGSNPMNLTQGTFGEVSGSAEWSTDGLGILFSADAGDGLGYDLWTMSPSGGDALQLTTTTGWDGNPRWRP